MNKQNTDQKNQKENAENRTFFPALYSAEDPEELTELKVIGFIEKHNGVLFQCMKGIEAGISGMFSVVQDMNCCAPTQNVLFQFKGTMPACNNQKAPLEICRILNAQDAARLIDACLPVSKLRK